MADWTLSRMTPVLKKLKPLLGVALFAAALWILDRELQQYHLHDLFAHLKDMSPFRVLLAFLAAGASYFALMWYDMMGFYYVGHPIKFSHVARASFIGYALSNNIGMAVFTGGSVRYRMYTAWGVSGVKVTQIVVFCTLTFILGFLAISGLVFFLAPPIIPITLNLSVFWTRILGLVMLLLLGGYFLMALSHKRQVRLWRWDVPLPTLRVAAGQVLVSMVDWMSAGAVLFVLLPSSGLNYFNYMAIFLLAQIIGVTSQVPGGLGVFESIMILLLSHYLPASSILGSLMLFRGIYYLLPLILATVLLGAQEIALRQERIGQYTRVIGSWISAMTPPVLSFAVFVMGAILLFSGATPSEVIRLQWLHSVLPLPIIEASHFFGSLVGASLLVIAWGIQRRIDAAYHLSGALLMAGILFSLLKGLDYEEALILSVILGALMLSHREFYRKGSLFDERFSLGWISAIAIVLLSTVWLGFFSYKHVEYSGELWWQFTLHGDAPRYLRGTVGATVVLGLLGLLKLLRPARFDVEPADEPALEKTGRILEHAIYSEANLVLLGDKTLLFNKGQSAFLMYGTQGNSWISMGDPVGDPEEMPELVWEFRELCDQHAAWPVFYEVRGQHLRLYVDLGLTILKLGEEARVPLDRFSLEGGRFKTLRHDLRKLEQEKVRFRLVPQEEVPGILPALREISDRWLRVKNVREKRFSLGRFDPAYLAHFPVAVLRQHEKIVAFANVWTSAGRNELSVDLMRHLPEAPHGLMDFLFVELMQWGRAEGYHWFNLGMAPLAGMADHEPVPFWNRLAALAYAHGEHFYHFQGLRRYKEKFNPEWEPKYLACPGGLALPGVIRDLLSLISGGLTGVIRK